MTRVVLFLCGRNCQPYFVPPVTTFLDESSFPFEEKQHKPIVHQSSVLTRLYRVQIYVSVTTD